MQKARDVRRALNSKGFTENSNRDHSFFFLYHDGKKSSVYTKISHAATDLDDSLCSLMARQMKLKNRQFHQFVDCQLGAGEYIKILTEARVLIVEQGSK